MHTSKLSLSFYWHLSFIAHFVFQLQVAVNYKQYDLLMHLVFSKLIGEMWIKFARLEL